MENRKSLAMIEMLLVLSLIGFAAQARAATPTFTVSATNVTMSSSNSSGKGSSSFTLTPLNGYYGTVGVSCYPTSQPVGARLPYCGGGTPPVGYTMNPSAVVTGSLPLFNIPVPEPVNLPVRRSRSVPAGLALAAMLIVFGFRNRPSRWLVLVLFPASALAGLATISGCGGSSSVVTPGTYSYTVKAVDTNSHVETSTFQVTVP